MVIAAERMSEQRSDQDCVDEEVTNAAYDQNWIVV